MQGPLTPPGSTATAAGSETYQLPDNDAERAAWAAQVGRDGMRLWQMLTSPDTPSGLVDLDQVQLLRRVWLAEYQVSDGQVVMRDPKDRPPAAIRLVSPYDLDARTGMKRGLGCPCSLFSATGRTDAEGDRCDGTAGHRTNQHRAEPV